MNDQLLSGPTSSKSPGQPVGVMPPGCAGGNHAIEDYDYSELHSPAGRAFRDGLPYRTRPWLRLSPAILPQADIDILYQDLTGTAVREYRSATMAGQIAVCLAVLYFALPPIEFDIHVHRDDPDAALLRRLIDTHALVTWPSDTGWWIKSDEASTAAPVDASFTDPASAWCVDPNDFTELPEIGMLIGDHRRRWPDIYGDSDWLPQPLLPCVATRLLEDRQWGGDSA